jgi:hypothetical protein
MGSGISLTTLSGRDPPKKDDDQPSSKDMDSVVANVRVETFIKGFLSTGNIRECLCKLWSSGCKDKFVAFIECEVPRSMSGELIQVKEIDSPGGNYSTN